jgi:protein-S-isoprenylcysteine O-methyltransferase Ste14
MKDRFVEWSKKKYTEKQRLIALIPEGILFVVIIPLILLVVPSYIDRWLNIPRLILVPFNIIAAILLMLFGLLFPIWPIQVQFKVGKGTPAPMMHTQELVITGPYCYCRNPMYNNPLFGDCSLNWFLIFICTISTYDFVSSYVYKIY